MTAKWQRPPRADTASVRGEGGDAGGSAGRGGGARSLRFSRAQSVASRPLPHSAAQPRDIAMTGYARGESDFAAAAAERYRRDARPASIAPKDYSVPLHVDCSIEYELPDCAKPPQGVKIEPLLMIHPAHFRRLEALRRVPFVNNLPRTSPPPAAPRRRRCCRPPPRKLPCLPRCGKAHPYLPPLDDLRQLAPLERIDTRALQQLPVFL